MRKALIITVVSVLAGAWLLVALTRPRIAILLLFPALVWYEFHRRQSLLQRPPRDD